MNGTGVKNELPSKMSKLLIQVRNILAHNDRLSSTAKLWLMMALDISNNRYNILPADLHQFYLTQLGDDAMSRIKKLHTKLSIQTSYQNVTLDSIHSNVNVLQQVSNTPDGGWDSPSSTTTLESDKPTITTTTAAATDMHGKYANKPRNFQNADAGFNNIGTLLCFTCIHSINAVHIAQFPFTQYDIILYTLGSRLRSGNVWRTPKQSRSNRFHP